MDNASSVEPPRKRQRRVEYKLSGSNRSSPSSSAHAALPEAPSAAGPSTSSVHRLSPTLTLSCGTSGSASFPELNTADETRQARDVRPDPCGADTQGDAQEPAPGMRDTSVEGKGKAKASAASPSPTTSTTTSTPTIMRSTASPPPIDWSLDQRNGFAPRPAGNTYGADTPRRPASGARAKAVLGVDEQGLAGLASSLQTEDEPGRDTEYYIAGADCVLRVEDTLFRVHRYLLGRDGSAFQHMFSMPSGGALPWQCIEGASDDHPIRLHGEKADRFRDLLSLIYALPHEIQEYSTPAANLDRLITICEMTNKYNFTSTESWAVGALFTVVTGLHSPPPPQYRLSHCSSAWMRRLLEVAHLCGHEPLRQLVAKRWSERIGARDLRPIHALEVAAQTGEAALRDWAYYVQLLELGPDFDAGVLEDGKQYARARLHPPPTPGGAAAPPGTNTEPQMGTPAVLTPAQKRRLLAGHWALSQLWERLRTTPPRFARPEGCTYHQHACVSTWTQAWRDAARVDATQQHAGVDVLARLAAMHAALAVHVDVVQALSPQCKRAAMLSVKTTAAEVRAGLAGYFADITDDVWEAAGASPPTTMQE
ncbi:hypothetical protein C2E23DRAFT_846287 [Lenzites betulinus]|nr:hypothetical protein C2E23DRAFT_846287 [Lenzites betulinus]